VIVCAGEALVDLVPDPRCGGGPMNVAVTAARLGAPTAFVGRISTDGFGDLLWRHLTDAGVHLEAAERGPEPTARALVQHDPTPVFHFDGDGTADTCLTHADLSPLGPGPHLLHGGTLGRLGRTAAVLAGSSSGPLPAAGVVPTHPTADRRGPGCGSVLAAAPRATCSLSSRTCLMWPGGPRPRRCGARLRRAAVAWTTAATASSHPWADPSSPPPVTVVDTAAGDAFCGGPLPTCGAESPVGLRRRARRRSGGTR
jgi:sugar/nucleoside kinase (ribokinase family)